MTTRMINLQNRLTLTPLLMTQEEIEKYTMMAPDSFLVENPGEQELEQNMDFYYAGSNSSRLYSVVNGVAVIPINGTLLHRVNWSGYGITGYAYIRAAFDAALADESVSIIAFDVQSGGGQVSGAFELANHIYENRGGKPILSILDSHAYSAAYLLASAADAISCPSTGGAGSIGVVTMHVDWSKAMDQYGAKITFIHAGKHKVDGNPYEALPKSVQSKIQKSVNKSYDLFVSTVAKFRGLSEEDVRGTEADTFDSDDALELGLIDVIASPEVAITSLVAGDGKTNEETAMSHGNQTSGAQATTESSSNEMAYTQTQMDSAKAESAQNARTEERERFGSVMASEHYEGRETLALQLLTDTDMSVDQINKTLSVAGKSQAESNSQEGSQSNHFEEAMGNSGNPEVGADTGNEQELSDQDKELNEFLADAKAGGIQFKD